MTEPPSPISSLASRRQLTAPTHESVGFIGQSGSFDMGLPASMTPDLFDAASSAGLSNDPLSRHFRVRSAALGSDLRPDESQTIADAQGLAEDTDYAVNTTRILNEAGRKHATPGLHLTTIPPPRTGYRDYFGYIPRDFPEAQKFAQILLWCLQRRLEHLQRRNPHPSAEFLVLVESLRQLQASIVAGKTRIMWQTRPWSAPEQPIQPNKLNNVNAARLELLRLTLNRVQEERDSFERMRKALKTYSTSDVNTTVSPEAECFSAKTFVERIFASLAQTLSLVDHVQRLEYMNNVGMDALITASEMLQRDQTVSLLRELRELKEP